MCKHVYEALRWASSFLIEHDREEHAARLLLENVLGKSYAGLLASMQDEISEVDFQTFRQYIEEHAKGKPVQYIMGEESFYGRIFNVNPSVLIPRPETEELIEQAIIRSKKLFGEGASLNFADIGTGSGAIAITFKKEWPEADVTATDLSFDALEMAKKNAEKLGAQLTFLQGDLAEPISEKKWDIILSNPPYIAFAEQDDMSDVVTNFEPHTALFAEDDGLALYKKLAQTLPKIMKETSLIGFEIGYQQGHAVSSMLKQNFPQAIVEVVKDINGKERMVFCTLHESIS